MENFKVSGLSEKVNSFSVVNDGTFHCVGKRFDPVEITLTRLICLTRKLKERCAY